LGDEGTLVVSLSEQSRLATNGGNDHWAFNSHDLKTAWTGSSHVLAEFRFPPDGKEDLGNQGMSDMNRCPCPARQHHLLSLNTRIRTIVHNLV